MMNRIVVDRRQWSAAGYQLDKLAVHDPVSRGAVIPRLPLVYHERPEIESTPAEAVHIPDAKKPLQKANTGERVRQPDLLAARF